MNVFDQKLTVLVKDVSSSGPMKINLKEIPDQGKTWFDDQKKGDLKAELSDLISSQPYDLEFSIKPLASQTYELSGHVKTAVEEQCSRCGEDFCCKVDLKVKDILLPNMLEHRNDKITKPNNISEVLEIETASTYEYNGDQFYPGEYFHEAIAVSLPYTPAPAENEKGECSQCGKFVKGQFFDYDEEMPSPESPFAVLKNLKV